MNFFLKSAVFQNLFIYINKLTKIVNNSHMNFDSVTCQDHKITKNPVKSNKNYFKIAKSVLKSVLAYRIKHKTLKFKQKNY